MSTNIRDLPLTPIHYPEEPKLSAHDIVITGGPGNWDAKCSCGWHDYRNEVTKITEMAINHNPQFTFEQEKYVSDIR